MELTDWFYSGNVSRSFEVCKQNKLYLFWPSTRWWWFYQNKAQYVTYYRGVANSSLGPLRCILSNVYEVAIQDCGSRFHWGNIQVVVRFWLSEILSKCLVNKVVVGILHWKWTEVTVTRKELHGECWYWLDVNLPKVLGDCAWHYYEA